MILHQFGTEQHKKLKSITRNTLTNQQKIRPIRCKSSIESLVEQAHLDPLSSGFTSLAMMMRFVNLNQIAKVCLKLNQLHGIQPQFTEHTSSICAQSFRRMSMTMSAASNNTSQDENNQNTTTETDNNTNTSKNEKKQRRLVQVPYKNFTKRHGLAVDKDAQLSMIPNNSSVEDEENAQAINSYNDLNLDPFVKDNYLNDLEDDPRKKNKEKAIKDPMQKLEGLL